jgi:methylmalonyl-CoA mutase N-terminal domain/subunit
VLHFELSSATSAELCIAEGGAAAPTGHHETLEIELTEVRDDPATDACISWESVVRGRAVVELATVRRSVQSGENVIPSLIRAPKARATLGEMEEALEVCER